MGRSSGVVNQKKQRHVNEKKNHKKLKASGREGDQRTKVG